MNKLNIIVAILPLMTTLCEGNRPNNKNGDFFTVDVSASYPKKELILQDFMDVEYIPLETNNEFVCQGIVLDVGKNIILIKNAHPNDNGDIFFFDRNGKALRKINRLGKSGEEYTSASTVILDEDNQELFVYDRTKTIVYDLHGTFKRSFRHTKDTSYEQMFNYNGENLMYKVSDMGDIAQMLSVMNHTFSDGDKEIDKNPNRQSFAVISKQDGHIIKEIQISFKEKKSPSVVERTGTGGVTTMHPGIRPSIINYKDSWIIEVFSSDTVFRMLPDFSLKPFIVRTPSIQSMNPEVFLSLENVTGRYYFMKTLKKGKGQPKIQLIYDKQEKTIFEYTMYNADYSKKESVFMQTNIANDGDIVFWQN